ncbi:hypothetical protein ACTMSW_17345 [Micromonospora sp. BQ11]|uniref:hypothetical protein n=1 Tax=Micromonospora sp. BQ11 TaxID=3452212 RepID=UPI003F889692
MSLSGPGGQRDADALPALFPAPAPEAAESRPPSPRAAGVRPVGGHRDGTGGPGDEDAARQLAFFGAEAADPSLADLAGLLAGPAEVTVMGGTARLSVLLDAAWRVHVIVAELAQRGLPASWEATDDARHTVRTSYTRLLKPLAAAWLHGPVKRPPAGFHLNGRRLRLWLAAAGTPEPPDVVLRLGPGDEQGRDRVGAALAAVGLPGATVSDGPGGPAYRVTGRRQLARLAELVGDRPKAAPVSAWPTRS